MIIATAGLEHRHGRPGDDRRRRPRRVPTRRGRADVACRCRTAWSTSPSPTRPRPSRSPSSTSRTSRARSPTGSAPTSALLRHVIPENRLRVYDVRTRDRRRWPTPARCSSCAATSASAWSPRSSASRAGRSASSPTTRRTSPARSTRDGADKAARFMQLCDAFDIPILFLCDTPGIMVGPEVEKTGAGAPLPPACSSPAPT